MTSDEKIRLTDAAQVSQRGPSTQAGSPDTSPPASFSAPENQREISSKIGWGGARPNSGGPRENSGGARPGSGRKPSTRRSGKSIIRPLGRRWCVVEAEHGRVDRAVRSVIDLGFDSYVATTLARVGVRDKIKQIDEFSFVPRPMFFQFFFVELDLDAFDWTKIRPDRAVSNGIARVLLTPGRRPAPVQIGLVEDLIADEPRRLKLPERGMKPIKPGMPVLIVRGVFEGQVATVEACDGFMTTVLLQVFGRPIPARVSRRDVSDE